MEAALSVNHLTFKTDRTLLNNATLEVYAGKFVTLMGENGSGKTTLVELLMGIRRPVSGEILFWGEKPTLGRRAEINKKVGWVVSARESYPLGISIRAFLEAVSPFYPTWDWELTTRLENAFQLDPSKRLSTLSLGEQSKVKLIKALAFHPKLLILDELTANLSPKSKKSILQTLLALFSEGDMGILYVSHSNEEAQKLSDRILVIEEGRICDRTEEVSHAKRD
jgi:ABC-2 type transport system ATP-binding protein